MTRISSKPAPAALGILLVGLTASVALVPSGDSLAQPPGSLRTSGQAREAQVPLASDLALIPPHAFALVHVQAAAIWKHERMAPLRNIVLKAGPEALQRLDTLFVPKISTLDRISVCLLEEERQDGEVREPLLYVILRFREAFDPQEVVRAYIPAAAAVRLEGGRTVYRSEADPIELWFPDRQHIVVGQVQKMPLLWAKPEGRDHPWHAILRQAERNHVTVAVHMASLPIPEHVRREIPPPFQPLLKMRTVVGALQLADKISLDVTAEFGTAVAAQEAEKALQALCELGRQQLALFAKEMEQQLFDPKRQPPLPLSELPNTAGAVVMLGMLKTVDEWLAKPQEWIKREESRLYTRVQLEDINQWTSVVSLGMGLLVPAVQRVREAASRVSSQNNLKQIALACHNFHDVHGHLPQDIVDKNGKPLLSWRVAILPYIEQEALYKQFKLDEPWDSEHNKKLIEQMPKIYVSPSLPQFPGLTYYKGFSGPGAVFETGKKIKLQAITDGLSNTILVIEAGPPVPWTKPEDIPFDPKKPLPPLQPLPRETQTNAALCDGSIRVLDLKKIGEKRLRLLIQRDDGQPIDFDFE